MESQLTPLRIARHTDRRCPDRTPDRVGPPSSDEYNGKVDIPPSVLPEQTTAPFIERDEMSSKSAEDISRKIRQDVIRHLLTARAVGNPAEYSYDGSAFVQSLIVGATSIRMNDVP